jgi:site-specific recombinase XerD
VGLELITVRQAWSELKRSTGESSGPLDKLTKSCLSELLERSIDISEDEVTRYHAALYEMWGKGTADHAIRTLRSVVAYGRASAPKQSFCVAPTIKKPRYKSERLPGTENVPTLAEVWSDYRRVRKLRSSTLFMYDERIRSCFGDWLNLQITLITKDRVEARHGDISCNRGSVTANLSCRILRSLMNFAKARYESGGEPILKSNPVSRLSELRCWNKEKPRRSYIHHSELGKWYRALCQLRSVHVRDLFLFLLFTGCRRSEAANLKWNSVDIDKKLVTFMLTKNGSDHCIPISDFIVELLERRFRDKKSHHTFVFASQGDNQFFLPGSARDKVVTLSGVPFTPHSCRRTWATTADACGIPFHTVGRILNHTNPSVTDRYICYDPERYRKEVDLVSEKLCGHIDFQPVSG